MYCELHCHTYYSLLDASSSPEALVDQAATLGMNALAITDHNGLYGAVAFWHAARSKGIRPIIGAELTLAHGSHLTLLAETQSGYANLSRLISQGQMQGEKGAPRLAIEDVAQHAQGLLCLTGCRQGAVAAAVLAGEEARAARAAGKLADIFGRDRVWVELQRHWLPEDARLNGSLLEVARRTGLPVVATNNVHYASPASHRLRDVLCATHHNCSLTELGARLPLGLAGAQASTEFYLKGEVEMATLFADLPEALAATQAIAERCDVSLDFSKRRTPAFPPRMESFTAGLPPGETPFSYLYGLSQAGLAARYRPITPPAVRQLTHELTVIDSTGLADYFLIVWDIVRYARSQGIRCQGRGSAANSLVAYVLGITPVDPLRHNLLFERFLSERQDTMPDIDIDFAADRRDEVVAYLYERYGSDHAAMVCNVVTYQWRSAVRDVARALGFAPEDVDRIANWANGNLPEANAAVDTPDALVNDHISHRWYKKPEIDGKGLPEESQFVIELASQLIDTPRHLSVHSGGMLITAQPLVEVVPLERATKEGIVVTQWNKDSVEDAGLIKIDLLCLRTLDVVSEANRLIAQRTGREPNLEALPLDDPVLYQMLAEGDTIGCFQVESRAQAQMLPRLKPRRFEDITIQVSIVRPGPIQGGMVHPYLRRRQGKEPVTYLHPKLEPILEETLGVIIFQEQVIRVAMALAGFTPGEADLLRRAMSRNRSAAAMVELRARFIMGAEANGVERSIAEEAFRQLQGFATYGFCKSHAASFALVAYQTLWLKKYYPVEFFCGILNHQPMGFYSPEVVVGDAQRHGVKILRPDANVSRDECTLEPQPGALLAPGLRLGLRYLHGLGEAGRERLLEARGEIRFTSLTDFCRRTRLPRSLIGDMIRAGALNTCREGTLSADEGPSADGDVFVDGRRKLLWALGAVQYEEEPLVEAPDVEVDLPALEEGEALNWDYELLGMSPGDHPMRLLRKRLHGRGVLTSAELAHQPAGQMVTVAGLVVVRQAPPTAKGHLFITLEDETGLANLIIRPDLYERQRQVLHNANFLLVKGLTQRDGKSSSMLVQEVQRLAA
jgi:error-prone DNA polymerase